MKKFEPPGYIERLKMLAKAGMQGGLSPNREQPGYEQMESLQGRLDKLIGVINNKERKPTNVLFFVLYDISSNKVRNYVAKYLLRQGCTRIQKSVFLADLDVKKYQQIKQDLTEVQSVYENDDSFLVVPISTDYLKSMSIIGKNISIDIITKGKNTLFF